MFIDVNVVLIGEVRLGARVKIGPNCIIQNARIGADTEVLAMEPSPPRRYWGVTVHAHDPALTPGNQWPI